MSEGMNHMPRQANENMPENPELIVRETLERTLSPEALTLWNEAQHADSIEQFEAALASLTALGAKQLNREDEMVAAELETEVLAARQMETEVSMAPYYPHRKVAITRAQNGTYAFTPAY